MYDELDKGFVLLTYVCIDGQVFFLSLSIGHIGILRGFDGTLEHSIIVLPTLLILEVATGSNDAVDIALEVTQLACDLRAFCKPGNIDLTVGDITVLVALLGRMYGPVNQLLSMQLEDGGWAVIGTVGDIDVTAMAVQALAVHCGTNPEVQSACDRALEFLSEHQQDYGGYQSFGTENLESTAQVVTALSALGIDGFSDERFIKNGNTLLTGMLTFRQPDGTLSPDRFSV